MKFKTSIFFCIAFFAIFMNGNTNAKNTIVAYRCPTTKEADDMDVRTSINNKDVRWGIDSKNYQRYDKPAEFMGVVLERQGEESFDMSVKCIYKSEGNKKYVFRPLKSFHWYVDAVAEKPIGSNWKVDSSGRLRCSKSITDCGFYFR